MPLNPNLNRPWFDPLAKAIPLAGIANTIPPTTPDSRPPLAVIGADEYWPAVLPQCVSGWEETQAEVLLRSALEAGLPKVRRRYSRTHKIIRTSMPVKAEFFDDFWNFYDILLDAGRRSFAFQHPYNKKWYPFRFTAVPSMRGNTDKMVWVEMSWEQI